MTTVVPPELAFLRECHKEKSKNFDNSGSIPDNILRIYLSNLSGDMEELWKKYLHWKFIYLINLDKKSPDSDDDFIMMNLEKTKPPESYLKEFIVKWKENAKDEKAVYIYRCTQIPPDVVHKLWYNEEINSCVKWYRSQLLEIRNMESDAAGISTNSRGKVLTDIYKEIPSEPFLDVYWDWFLALIFQNALADLKERIEKTYERLLSCPVTETEILKVTGGCQTTLESIWKFFRQSLATGHNDIPLIDGGLSLKELYVNLKTVLSDTYDEEALIKNFLWELRNTFNCEVCDYCDYNKFEGNREWVVWRTATVTTDDLSEKMRKLSYDDQQSCIRERESYKKGEGISGTIILQTSDKLWNLWHHKGSNNVLKDQRQSAFHRHAYEKDIYPGVLKFDQKIHNFWMFPIFESEGLIGGFRVVNKLDSNGDLQVGAWPYLTRVSLALIAAWFSKFLESEKQNRLVKQDLLASNTWNKQVDELIDKVKPSWVDNGLFFAILRHFERIMFTLEETRRVGSSVLLLDDTVDHELEDYPGLDIFDMYYPYKEMDTNADKFDPLVGTYVFNGKKFKKLALLQYKNENGIKLRGYKAICAITKLNDRSIHIVLPRNTRNILFYRGGKRIAELYMSEKSGEWKFRAVEDFKKILFENVEIENKKVIEMVLEASLELSARRFGAMIVLGDLSKNDFNFEPECEHFQGPVSLKSDGTHFLIEYAKLDGAIIIDNLGQLVHANTKIYPKNDTTDLKIYKKNAGARHTSGEKICIYNPHALVIIISMNGPIDVVKNKKRLLKNF